MKAKETVTSRVSLGEQIARLLPEGSDALREHVRRVWSHTYSDTRGVDAWMAIVEFREPMLRFEVESRGVDRLVWPVIDAPPPSGVMWSSAVCGLRQAKDILWRIVERAWGGSPHRYHWAYARSRQRFERERAALERTFRAAVDDVWIPLAMSALECCLDTPIWRASNGCSTPQYHVGSIDDATLASGRWIPISPVAYQQVDAWRERVDRALALLQPRIRRLTADDVRGYARAGCPPHTHPINATNRPSYLLSVLQWVERGRPEHPPIVDEVVPGLWEAIERDEAIVSHCHALRVALAEGIAV
jgi:hypothetical protein